MGYVLRGPVLLKNNQELRAILLNGISSFAMNNNISILFLQPPKDALCWVDELPELGFHQSKTTMGLGATVIISLVHDIDDILMRMSSGTRYNIRICQQKGIIIREGTTRDLHTYYDLVLSTARRQNFEALPEEFFSVLWASLTEEKHVKLFIAEYKGRTIAGQLLVAFGDTVVNKLSVWSGEHGDVKPNEALLWHSICWSKAQGYRFFDLEGIESDAAESVLNGKPIPDHLRQSLSSFKLGFGGYVMLLPALYDHVYDPRLRGFYDNISFSVNMLV